MAVSVPSDGKGGGEPEQTRVMLSVGEHLRVEMVLDAAQKRRGSSLASPAQAQQGAF